MRNEGSIQYTLHSVQNFSDHSHGNSLSYLLFVLKFYLFVYKGEKCDICVTRHRSLWPGELYDKLLNSP